MATYIILDYDNKVINNVAANKADDVFLQPGQTIELYEGPVWIGAQWDGQIVIDPTPPDPISDSVPSVVPNGGPTIVAE